jgi:hypothetical protein
MLREVNRLRKVAGLERVPVSAVRWKRWIVQPFGKAVNSEGEFEEPRSRLLSLHASNRTSE